jgi:hypothetical protein
VSAGIEGSGTTSLSDCMLTIKSTGPTPGNVTAPENTGCKLPVSTISGGVRFPGLSKPFSPWTGTMPEIQSAPRLATKT